MSYISKICQISIKDHFGPFGQVSLRIQSEYGKIRTRKNSVFGHFSHSATDRNVSSILDSSYFMRFWIKEFKKLKSIFLGYIGMLGG